MFYLKILILMVFLGMGGEAKADALILIHGYFSDENGWNQSGVIQELETAGWKSSGTMTATPRGIQYQAATPGPNKQTYYLVDLPSEASLMMQAQQLKEIVLAIQKQRGHEKIFLIGHSAGGVVARLTMVNNPKLTINGLISIASPHLGSDKAEMVGLLANTPMAIMAPMMGVDTLNHSKQLYDDLIRERPGSFLYWLNRQPHPKAHYLSIIRQDSFALFGDNVVPTWSQDMGNVAALKEQTQSITLGTDHALGQQDGTELVRILDKWIL